jgi:hypothetical protein
MWRACVHDPLVARKVVVSMFRRVRLTIGLAALLAVSVAQSAFAVQDYTAVTSTAAAEIGAALPVALGVVGIFVGVMLAYKVLRRVIRA